jgi:tetratricopeptide (TPR) repeat protein
MMQLVGDDEALALYRRATAIDPTFAAAYNQIGYVHLRKGDLGGAEQALKQYVATRPDSPNPYDSYAELLLRMGRYDESVAQYEKALTKAPDFSGSLVGIGHNYVFKGDYAKARASYARLYDTGDAQDKLSSLYWNAVSFVHEGKTAEALQALDRQRELALKEGLAPAAMNALLDQARLLSQSGKAADAKAHIDQAEAMIGGAPFNDAQKASWGRNLLLARAQAAAQAKDFAAARSALDRVKAEITPDLAVGWKEGYETVVGMVDVLEGNHDAALPHLEQASPENPLALFYRAEALRLKGDAAGAAAMYKKVVALNANSMGYALVRSGAMKRTQP